MSRKATTTPAASTEPSTLPATHIIHPDAVYTVEQARRVLGLRANSLKREIREHRLAVCKRCGRYYVLGDNLLAWLRGGERAKKAQDN